MLSLILLVTIATAVSVGDGAAAPRWSGTHKMSYPRSSARFTLSTNAERDLKNRMLSPKRKSLPTNNLRSTNENNYQERAAAASPRTRAEVTGDKPSAPGSGLRGLRPLTRTDNSSCV